MALIHRFIATWLLLTPLVANAALNKSLPFPNTGKEGKPLTIAWAAPSSTQNGTPIAQSRLGGFRIYLGKDRKKLFPIVDIDAHYVSSYELVGLAIGTYFIGLTAYDDSGAESKLSNIAQVNIVPEADTSTAVPDGSSLQRQLDQAVRNRGATKKMIAARQIALNEAKKRLKTARNTAQRRDAQNTFNSAQRSLNQSRATLNKIHKLVAALNDVRNHQNALTQARHRRAQARTPAQKSSHQKEVNSKLTSLQEAQQILAKVQQSD